MTLRSEGRFEADGFERVIMIRIYEEEDGFHIHAKPWFQLTDDPRAAEGFGPIPGGPQRTLTIAKNRAKRAVEGNVSEFFKVSYSGKVVWDDEAKHLQSLEPW
jgi:hypothetical protein